MPFKAQVVPPMYGQEETRTTDEFMAPNDRNVSVRINVELRPFGQVAVGTGYAHPDRFAPPEKPATPLTPVMPLMSSAITPGFARPVSI